MRLIIVSGLPGSGKSTLAEALAKNLRSPIFSVDPIESAVIKSGIPKSFETGLAAYLIAESLASENLKTGMSVIIDAVCPVKESRETWRSLAKEALATLVVIECVLDPQKHKLRIESRIRNMPGLPEVTWNDVENRRKEYLAWEANRLVIDSGDSFEKNLEKALAYIAGTV